MSKDREDEIDGVSGESVDPTVDDATADDVVEPGVSDPDALAEAEADVADDPESRVVDEAGVAVQSGGYAIDEVGDLAPVDADGEFADTEHVEDTDADFDEVDEVDLDLADDDQADDEVLEEASVGAAAAGSARAAARRTARTGVTEKKGAATRTRSEAVRGKENFFQRIVRFLREVYAELAKVIWPGRKPMVTYTIVVVLFLIFMVSLVYGADLLFTFIVDKVMG